MMNTAWAELERETEDKVWNRFYEEFSFKASVDPANWPGIVEPTPSVTYSIATLYNETHFWQWGNDVHQKALAAFRHCVSPEQKLYVLDWQHSCYSFWPHGTIEANDFEQWCVPVFPDGEHNIFLAEDFSFGTFGHPWEQTICVFGQSLIDEFERDRPTAFQTLRRK